MNELVEYIVNTYSEQLFYFSLKKTSDTHEAEDLTQEIILEVIKSLSGGSIPADTKA